MVTVNYYFYYNNANTLNEPTIPDISEYIRTEIQNHTHDLASQRIDIC